MTAKPMTIPPYFTPSTYYFVRSTPDTPNSSYTLLGKSLLIELNWRLDLGPASSAVANATLFPSMY